MHADQGREQQEDIRATIDLTSKLQQSLRKLLTKKKSIPVDIFAMASPRHEEVQWESKMRLFEEENRELHQDNQQLSQQLLSAREQLRQCQKELAGTRKYLAFLQAYNDDLKKQMLFWMKSRRKQPQDEPSSVNQLMKKIVNLRRENQQNEKKLLSLKDTVEIKPASHSLSFDLSKFQNDLIRRRKSQANDCTSCSYKSNCRSKSNGHSKQKNHPNPQQKQPPIGHYSNKECKPSRKNSGQSSKGKNLRKWHNHYISTSEFAY